MLGVAIAAEVVAGRNSTEDGDGEETLAGGEVVGSVDTDAEASGRVVEAEVGQIKEEAALLVLEESEDCLL